MAEVKAQLVTLCGYAAKRSPMAVMNCVRITEGFGYATDGVSSLRYEWDGPEGVDVCVDANQLAAALSGFADDQYIKVVPGDGHIHVQAGRRKLKLRTVPVDGMPEIEVKGEPMVLPGDALESALKFCFDGSLANSIVKPEYGNVVVEFGKNDVWVIGIDGFRGHFAKLDVPAPKDVMQCFVPRALAKRLADLCKGGIGGKVQFYKDRAIFERGGMKFICMLSTAIFPNWRMLLAHESKYKSKAPVGTRQLEHAMHGANQLGIKYTTVDMKPGTVVVSGNEVGEEFEQEIDIDYDGDQAAINVRPKYVLDAASHMGEFADVSIGVGLPLMLRSGDLVAVIQGSK